MLPRVTIVIPFYNDPYVEQAISSALGQTYPNLEVIVVDDGSTLYQDRINPFVSRVHYLGKSNGGTASAINHGVRMSSGDYIAWLSSDDLFYPHKIARQLAFMQQYNSLLSFTAFDQINELGHVTAYAQAARYSSQSEFIRAFSTCDPINGCTIMFKKELVARVGLFDESLRYTQDYEYWIRALLSGVNIHFLDEPLTKYRWHDQMGTMRFQPHILAEVQAVQNTFRHRLEALALATPY
jgi:glycosyltransferase involved in cell wall biosynthesis